MKNIILYIKLFFGKSLSATEAKTLSDIQYIKRQKRLSEFQLKSIYRRISYASGKGSSSILECHQNFYPEVMEALIKKGYRIKTFPAGGFKISWDKDETV